MSRLSTNGLVKRFGDVAALDGLDMEVDDGSIMAVLGPSGCGKTTLLRLIAGFLAPDAGTVSIDGLRVADRSHVVPTKQRKVGLVPQEGALFPHLDVAANISFGLPRSERKGPRVAELLDLVELPRDLADRRPAELSGGQQQRVAVARALAPEPTVLLLDEPFSSLDAALRASTGRAVVNAIRARKATAVLVTHDQDEALSLADQVGIMDRGRLLQAGPPHSVYTHPTSPFVAAFVGDGSLLPARLDGDHATCSFGSVTVDRSASDSEVLIFVRPEQVIVRPAADGGALVTAVAFHGHEAVVRLIDEGSRELIMARVPATLMPQVGDRLAVTLQGPVLVFERGA
ncbi:MAG: ABC transporter ATP-binding protein [Aeromicrobium sp.]